MAMAPMSFTLTAQGLLRELKTSCLISEALKPQEGTTLPIPKRYSAIWDTGANGCVISKGVVKDLGLKPSGIRQVLTSSSPKPNLVNSYLVNIYLPNKIVVPFVQATEGDLIGFDILIGMDIIQRGDFAITHKGGNTKFTFQIPSTHDIDFVAEHRQNHNGPSLKGKQPGRNDPCPCGSGKKYKNCHGKNK